MTGREPTDRAAALVTDIEAVPGTLDRLAGRDLAAEVEAALAAIAPHGAPFRRVLVVGHGSSRFAAFQAEAAFRHAGLDPDVQPAASDTLGGPLPERLCIAISSGGTTPEVVRVAERLRGQERILAVTRDAGSPLAAAADATIALPVAPEASGLAITSFVATIGLLLHVAASLGPAAVPAFEREAGVGRRILDDRDRWLPAALAHLDGAEEVAVLAPWSERGTAEQAALLLREGPRRSAAAFESADWLHVGVYTALPGVAALLFDGSAADAEVERTITSRGGRVLRVSSLGPDLAATDPGARLTRIVGPALLAAAWWRAITGD